MVVICLLYITVICPPPTHEGETVKCWNCKHLVTTYLGKPSDEKLFEERSDKCKVKRIVLGYYAIRKEKNAATLCSQSIGRRQESLLIFKKRATLSSFQPSSEKTQTIRFVERKMACRQSLKSLFFGSPLSNPAFLGFGGLTLIDLSSWLSLLALTSFPSHLFLVCFRVES